ncbi:MAG: ATP-binding cassette domain-containing protein [bacterium]|nr:ATP-binding cassette domain-containing protein [bacterium]
MIRIENIGVLREEWVFRNVSLELPQGKLMGVIGDSGAGKTSFLKAIAGFLDIVEGKVSLDGKKLIGPSEKLVPGYEEIQLVNQDFELETFHTVAENIKEKVLHLPKEHQSAMVEEMLELLELNDIRDRQVRSISGGEQQRVSIARALACEPRYLLLDEPFVHLDQRLRMKLMAHLKSLNNVRNTTILLVSHDGAEMMGFVDDVVHLSDGSIQRIASANDMYYHPENERQAVLMGIVNKLMIDGEEVLFRPTEYTLENPNISVKFDSGFDTGIVVFNYFLTETNTRIVLSSRESMEGVTAIRIQKHA